MSDPELPITGGCLCGGVRFEISEPLERAGYCHCTRCQRRTGTAAAASAMTVPGSFRIVQGEELVRKFEPPDGSLKAFCVNCGSALFAEPRHDPAIKVVRLGALDGDPGVRPSYRQHLASAASWEPVPDDGLERFEGQRPR